MRRSLAAAVLVVLLASVAGAGHALVNCPHSSPHAHTYGTAGAVVVRSDAVTGGSESGVGSVTVYETNAMDCDGDGAPWDYDGDYETGVGGGFFGYGPWADEGLCSYGLRVHGPTATVNDVVFGSSVWFKVGADDTSGPVIETDPVTGETSCSTSGSITPGDPTTNPAADADDCVTVALQGTGTTCGAGGDGGYWVLLVEMGVTEEDGNIGVGNTPTAGTITA